ncbi:Tim44 domain-containing protein [Amphritea sp. HPY]|uniref:Tim44 domain-containing protein n=1 Tax=Amphritea sp. HPY TaxID=3421652 RepID=UPI003D7D6AE2
MRTLLISIFTLVLGFGLVVPDAEAKRMGGGFSLGKSYSTPKRVQPAPSKQQAATNNTTQQGVAPKKRGFGGLMGGLLAGGLLGALFFGGAFEGIQFMDILLFGLLAFVAIKIFSGMKRTQSAQQYAGAQQHYRQPEPVQSAPQEKNSSQDFQQYSPAPEAGFGAAGATLQLPQWFNEKAFLDGAQQHFGHLQKAWDDADWNEIESYTSPELLALLREERSKQAQKQNTEVVSVMAELANFIDNGDHVVATINFYGWMKEDSNETTEFSELWHLHRDMTQPDSDWKIVGIQQP